MSNKYDRYTNGNVVWSSQTGPRKGRLQYPQERTGEWFYRLLMWVAMAAMCYGIYLMFTAL